MLMTKDYTSNIASDVANLVIFRLNHVHYAIAIEPIQQIIEMVTITPVLKTEAWMEGIINYHGIPTPVINLRRHFGMDVVSYHWHTPIILVNLSDHQVGLIVDDVLDVLAFSPEQIADPRSILPDSIPVTPLLKGIIQIEKNVVLFLDQAYLFDQTQVTALSAAAETLREQALHDSGQKLPSEKAHVIPQEKAKKTVKTSRSRTSNQKTEPASAKLPGDTSSEAEKS